MEALHSKSHRSTCSSINECAFHSARGSLFSDGEEDAVPPMRPCSGATSESVVRLTVGGTSFATSLGALTAGRTSSSYFTALFGSGHWSYVVAPGSQTPFVDRNSDRSRQCKQQFLDCMPAARFSTSRHCLRCALAGDAAAAAPA